MILLEAHFLELANVRPQEAENRMRGRTPNERSGHDQESAQGAPWRVRDMPVPIIFGHRRGLRYRYERIADRTRLFTRILIRLLGGGMFRRVAAGAEELGGERTTDGTSAKRGTSIYGRCWCKERTTF